MSENKKYYYLKFKENYFEQDHIKVIEAMDNGYIYSLIILKLYLKSLKYEGQLKINETIPYMSDKIDILSRVINHDPDHVMKAINLAKSLGIVEILHTGEIFMADIQNFIGHSNTESDRKNEYRKRIKSCNDGQLTEGDNSGTNTGTFLDNRPPEIEIEIELDIEKERKNKYGSLENVSLTLSEYSKLTYDYGISVIDNYIERLSLYIPNRAGKRYKDHNAVIRTWLNRDKIAKISHTKEEKLNLQEPIPNQVSADSWKDMSSKIFTESEIIDD